MEFIDESQHSVCKHICSGKAIIVMIILDKFYFMPKHIDRNFFCDAFPKVPTICVTIESKVSEYPLDYSWYRLQFVVIQIFSINTYFNGYSLEVPCEALRRNKKNYPRIIIKYNVLFFNISSAS